MGLDAVELIINVEESFGIAIADEEAQKVQTVQELHDLIINKIVLGYSTACFSQVVFYKLRKGLVSCFETPRNMITSDSKVNELIPQTERHKAWQQLSSTTQLRLPILFMSPLYNLIIAVASLGTLAVLLSYSIPRQLHSVSILSFLVPVIIAIGLLSMMYPLADRLPRRYERLGALTKEVEKMNRSKIIMEYPIPKERVMEMLIIIISEQLGIERSIIHPHSSLYNDLGL